MRFSGVHRGAFFGVPATGRHITWVGSAFFTIAAGKIVDIWVLGDADTVKQQLGVDVGVAWRGEAEIGAWEIASGCGRHHAAWILNLWAILAPSAVLRDGRSRGATFQEVYATPRG